MRGKPGRAGSVILSKMIRTRGLLLTIWLSLAPLLSIRLRTATLVEPFAIFQQRPVRPRRSSDLRQCFARRFVAGPNWRAPVDPLESEISQVNRERLKLRQRFVEKKSSSPCGPFQSGFDCAPGTVDRKLDLRIFDSIYKIGLLFVY
jgi:hypothetical protein